MIEIKEDKISFNQICDALRNINNSGIFNKDLIEFSKNAIGCIYAVGNMKTIILDETLDDKAKLEKIKLISISDLKNYDWEEELL